MDYAKISKETFRHLYQSRTSLQHSPLKPTLVILVELRTSQMNDCPYCCKLHTQEAKKIGVPEEKIQALSSWSTSPLFSEEEKAALQWIESVTRLDVNLQELKKGLLPYFSEREIVDLTACTGIMNALNRIAISLGGAD